MDIVVFVDENGTADGECDHRAFEICEEDEQTLFVMIGHSKGTYGKPEKVYVLTAEEYGELDDKAKKYEKYIDWKKARDIYISGKGEFENLH